MLGKNRDKNDLSNASILGDLTNYKIDYKKSKNVLTEYVKPYHEDLNIGNNNNPLSKYFLSKATSRKQKLSMESTENTNNLNLLSNKREGPIKENINKLE